MLKPMAWSQKYLDLLKRSTVGETSNFVADPSAVKARAEAQFTDLVAQLVQARRTREEVKGADGEGLRARRL